MEKYIETLQQAADRGDLAACAALVNYHGLRLMAEAVSGIVPALGCLDDNGEAPYVRDFDADNEELASVPDEVPPVVFEPEPLGEIVVGHIPPAKPIRASTKARTEL